VTLRAVILAGGLGTRLRPAVGDTPKVMAPVAGRPFLEHVLGQLDAQGFVEVVLAVGYRKELIAAHFGASFRGLSLRYSEEQAPLGTGGAVRKALPLAGPGPCFVLNGDTWLALDHADMLRAHLASGAMLSMAVRAVPDVARYGAVRLEDSRVTRFEEKGRTGPGFINAGVYLLQPDLLAGPHLPEAFSFEADFLAARLPALAPLAWIADGPFIDIGIPEDYQRAQAMFARGEPG
jgi:D-glycero-alpha-D-manno-heptose 1-phosphate guanylyltransferase